MKNLSALTCLLLFTLAACNDHNSATSDTLKIPKLGDIKVDGDAVDWGVKGLPVQLFADYHGTVPDTGDLQANIRLGWDDSGLLILLKVKDDTLYEPENKNANDILSGDAVELFLCNRRGGRNMVQYIIGPGLTVNQPELRVVKWDCRGSRKLAGSEITIDAKTKVVPGGYVLEARLPFANVGEKPGPGVKMALQVNVTDADRPGDKKHRSVQLNYIDNAYLNTFATQSLELADSPGWPIVSAVKCYIQDYDTAVFKIFAENDSQGKEVSIRDSTLELYHGRLKAGSPYSGCTVMLPVTAINKDFRPVQVFIDGQMVSAIDVCIAPLYFVKKHGYPFEESIRVFKLEDHLHKPPLHPILFIGHSQFRYWLTLKDDMPGLTVLNRAFGGSQAQHVNHFMDETVFPYKPKSIVYWEGANDFATGKPVSVFMKDVQEFVDSVKVKLPDTKIYMLSPVYLASQGKYAEADKLIKDLAAETPNLIYIDVTSVLSGLTRDMYRPDGVHLNSKGDALLAKTIRDALKVNE